MNTPAKRNFFIVPGHAKGELRPETGDITITSLLDAVRPNRQILRDTSHIIGVDLMLAAKSYLKGLPQN